MQQSKYPCFGWFLSDENGSVMDLSKPGAMEYINLSAGGNYAQSRYISNMGRLKTDIASAILVKGFVTVYNRRAGTSITVPFSGLNCMHSASSTDDFSFVTTCFGCSAVPIFRHKGGGHYASYIKIRVYIKTAVYENSPEGCQEDAVYRTSFCTCITTYCRPSPVKAQVTQFCAVSDGKSRVYTGADALPEYGGQGLVCSDEVTIHNLFINGMVQPYNNYRLSKDALELLTNDVPNQGEPIVVSYIKLLDDCNRTLSAAHRYYITVADGVSTAYTDGDRLTEYESSGLPDPHAVSYYNLYVNAVLQPAATYTVRKGLLLLSAPPAKGEYVVFESVAVFEP